MPADRRKRSTTATTPATRLARIPIENGIQSAVVDDELPEAVAENRVSDRRVRRLDGRRIEHRHRDGSAEAHDGGTGDPAPAARQQAAVREDERDRDRPGEEQRNRCALRLERPAAPKSCSALSWTDGANDPSSSIQAMTLRGMLERDQQADDRRREQRERQERIDLERNPVPFPRRDHLEDVQEADSQLAAVASAMPQARIRSPRIAQIIRLSERNRNRCWHRDRRSWLAPSRLRR